MGLVYFQGVLGYHMWTEFYVAGAWRALDAAFGLEAADPTHIKLGESSLSEGFLDQGMVKVVGLIAKLDIKVIDYTLAVRRKARADGPRSPKAAESALRPHHRTPRVGL